MNKRTELNANQSANDYLDGFINEERAADFLCQSIRTIQKWRVTGYGPKFYKSGRSVRYRRRDLMEWTESRCHASTSDYDPA